MSLALVNKGKALGRLGKADEASAVWDDVVRRFGADIGEGHALAVATALASKGKMLGSLDRHTEALAAWNELAQRFGKSPAPEFQTLVAKRTGWDRRSY